MFGRIVVPALLMFAFGSLANAQFGGAPGDAVIYTVTFNGAADIQVPPVGTVNSAATLASLKKIVLDTVPIVDANPFPLARQVLYTTDKETFQIGTDSETTVGLHRIFVVNTKLIVIEGTNLPVAGAIGQQNNFISFPVGIDLEKDVALESLRVATFFPKAWPMMILTDKRGSLGPPDIPGFAYLFQLPNAVKLPALMPWTNMNKLYPGVGWKPGSDLKLLEVDNTIGSTIREMKLHPGIQTPAFRTAGHNHLFILSGSVTLTPAGGAPIVLNKYDYIFIPEGLTYTLTNPMKYSGPVKK